MRLFAKQPCNFGRQYLIGDEIPVYAVLDPKAQEKMGVLTIVEDGATAPDMNLEECVSMVGQVKFEIPVHGKTGETFVLRITEEDLTIFSEIRQIDVKKAEDKQKIADMIQKIESADLLIMLDALDGRTFVKEKVDARAQEITDGDE